MSEYYYEITARWRVEPTPPRILGEKFLCVLDTISSAVPEIGNWQLGKPPYRDEYLTIEEARTNLAGWVEDNQSMMDGAPAPESGYALIATNMGKISPKIVGLATRIGGRLGDSIRFYVGFVDVGSDLETVTYPLFRAALLAIATHWPLVWASAGLYVPNEKNTSWAPSVSPHRKSAYNKPWLSYLCAPLTKGLVPPVGVPCERTPDGGLLMIAAEERLDPTNPDHLRRSRSIEEIMISRAGDPARPGYWPLDEEWPPTPEALARRSIPPSSS